MSDFLIIGGGVAGLSAAAALAPHGTVTVLEAEPVLGYHASGRSAALFEKSYGSRVVRALNRASEADHIAINVLSPRGLMLVAGIGEEDKFDADVADMEIAPISIDEAIRRAPCLDPARVTRAAYSADARDIDTDRLLQHYARTVRQHGGQVITGARATAIAFANGRWQVTCGTDTYSAKSLINSAGAWADEIATLAGVTTVGLTACRRSMARVPAPDGLDVSNWPLILGAGETWYAKPDAGCLLISPADEEPVPPQDAWAEDLTLAEGIARYEAVAREPVKRMLSNWAGLRTFAPDRALVIGEAPGSPGFFWMAGQGGYGFQTAPAAARLLAAHVLGQPSELDKATVAALSPARFNDQTNSGR
ncbi:MAG: FAD-binding oxidoreductase [Rhodobacteraceae bacterium]|nr:FAD-binding oxidoreductase [Paracoccaceae bacterium]